MAEPVLSNIPIPDPSLLTTEGILRAVAVERLYVDGQLQVITEKLAAVMPEQVAVAVELAPLFCCTYHSA